MVISPDPASSQPPRLPGPLPPKAALPQAMPARGRGHRFSIADALHNGMTAFRRTPLTFSIFSAGLTALQVLPLQGRLMLESGRSLQPLDALLFLLGFHPTVPSASGAARAWCGALGRPW